MNNKLYIQELEKRIEEISGANKGYKLENRRLRKRIDKVLDFINAWKDNKTELKVSMLDLLQIEDILRGEDER